MTKLRKSIALILTLIIVVSVLGITALTAEPGVYPKQSDTCNEYCCTSIINHTDNPIEFDWYDYQAKLSETEFQLRIHHELEFDEIKLIILWRLVNDGVIEPYVLNMPSHAFVNNHIFDQFVEDNV